MDPDNGPTERALIAQLTIPDDARDRLVHFNAQGRSSGSDPAEPTNRGHDWRENCISVHVGGRQNGQGTHAMPSTPDQTQPAPPHALTACADPSEILIAGQRYFGAGALTPTSATYPVGTRVRLQCDRSMFVNGNPTMDSVQVPCSANGVFPRIICRSAAAVKPASGCRPSAISVGNGRLVPDTADATVSIGTRLTNECQPGFKWCSQECNIVGATPIFYECRQNALAHMTPSTACGLCSRVYEPCTAGKTPPPTPPPTHASPSPPPLTIPTIVQCEVPAGGTLTTTHLVLSPILTAYVAGTRVSVSCQSGYVLQTATDYRPQAILLVCTGDGTFLSGDGHAGFPVCILPPSTPKHPPHTLPPARQTPVLPSPPILPPPTSNGALVCDDFVQFQRISSLITAECCNEGTEDCEGGMPTSCNGGCASILLPAQVACAAFLSSSETMRPVLDVINQAAERCPNACSTFDQFTQYTTQLSDACCGSQCQYLPSWTPGCESTCTNNIPTACSAQCAQTLVPMFQACGDFLDRSGLAMAVVKNSLQDAAARCNLADDGGGH